MIWLLQNLTHCVQVGDLAVIDISATTIDEEGTTGESIPDAESKGSTEPYLLLH